MEKELKALKRIRKMYEYFVKNHRVLEPKLMICEKEDFEIVEKNLKTKKIKRGIGMSDKKFVDIVGDFLLEEFDTTQCHIKIYWVGFAYNHEDIYCLVSKHNTNGKEITRFGNKTQILGMIRSYYYKKEIKNAEW